MKDRVLSVKAASVRSVSQLIFEDLNFSIAKGQQWALIGQSGSGKTALLQTLAGKLPLVSGEIEYHFYNDFLQAHNIADPLLTAHRLIAYVGARHHFKNLSNTTDLYYQQRYNSIDSDDSPTVASYLADIESHAYINPNWPYDKVVTLLQLGHLEDKELIKLSNGETKRLLIAAALLKHPKLLLLDQPLTGLDMETRGRFDDILQAIAASGISIAMATSPAEVPPVITDIAILGDCKIITQGKKDVLQRLQVDAASGQALSADISELYKASIQATYSTVVEMQNVNIRYGEKQVLHDVSWRITGGERWALLGPNGAGKSTLLSLINGDNPQAYANNIELFGRKRGSGESIWDIKRNIGFVSPELYQYFPPDTSCLNTVLSGYFDTLGLFRRVTAEQTKTALECLQALNLNRYAQQLLKNVPLSVQRLCLLARALVKTPPLLILDEPCQGMDTAQQQYFKQVIDALCGPGSNLTLIFVTHYQHELPDCVSQILRLNNGRVVE